jgi:uncharacterized protein YgbK (DUF1537 family)
MYLGVIADDFTGASDIANTPAKGGLATTPRADGVQVRTREPLSCQVLGDLIMWG